MRSRIPDRVPDATVTFRDPPSTNDLWEPCMRNGRPAIRLSAKYAKWAKEAAMTAAYERKGPRMDGCFVVRVILPVGKKDANNNDKALLDALQAGSAITNDRLLRGYEVWQDTEQAPNFVLVQLWRVEELSK